MLCQFVGSVNLHDVNSSGQDGARQYKGQGCWLQGRYDAGRVRHPVEGGGSLSVFSRALLKLDCN